MFDHALLALSWLAGTAAGWLLLGVVLAAGIALGRRLERRRERRLERRDIAAVVMLAREDEALAIDDARRATLALWEAREAHARRIAELEGERDTARRALHRWYRGETPKPLIVERDR